MIKQIRLTNFFSFKEETINFEKDVNLLVGINGSGKSNLFKAIQLLKVGVTGNSENNALFRLIVEEWGGFDNIYFKGDNEKNGQAKIELEFVLDKEYLSGLSGYIFNSDITYEIEIYKKNIYDNYYINEHIWEKKEGEKLSHLKINSGSGDLLIGNISYSRENKAPVIGQNGGELTFDSIKDSDSRELILARFNAIQGYFGLRAIQFALRDISIYPYFDTTPNSKTRKASSASATVRKLLPDGRNLPQLLHTLKLKNKTVYRKIVKTLKDINPNFNGFDFNVLGSGQMEMYLDENDLDSAIHLAHVSDGTLRYLCLLSIFFNPNRGSLICIDEPEMGLHPDMIFSIFMQIDEASLASTFLVSTQSPAFLNKFRIEKIRVIEKNEKNETTVNQFAEDDFEGWYEEFNPGKMWTSGDFGGTRW